MVPRRPNDRIQAGDSSGAQQITARSGVSGNGEGSEALKQELNALKEESAKAKSEASVAQRGLALSQKALTETREALRQATEGAALAKGSLENLRKENSTLVQQNMLLQAQHDQVSRDLSSAKAKLTAR